MSNHELPPEIVDFLNQHIDSVPHLEALLLLRESGERKWTEQELGAAIYVNIEVARGILRSFLRKGFVIRAEQQEKYIYAPTLDASGSLIPAVTEYYRRHLIQVATFLHTRGSQAVREFSRAFDMKKERG